MAISPFPQKPTEVGRFVEVGRTGLDNWAGQLQQEFLRELRGSDGVKTYREMSKNDGIIGASLLYYINLAKGVDFRIESADQGNSKAEEIAEFVNGALFDDMNMSWNDILGEIYSFLIYGWSWFEVVYKVRGGDVSNPMRRSRFNDGRIGWRKWAIRGQDTLDRWDLDETGGVRGMFQRAAPDYLERYIPIWKSLLFRTQVEQGSPEGVSILRTAYTSWYEKRRLRVIRGIGVERDLAGLPVITPPEGVDLWNSKDPTMLATKSALERIVRNIRRDENEGVVKPFGYTLELLSSSGSRQFDINAVIAQINSEIAISLATDFMLIGHEKVGSRAVTSDKTSMYSLAASAYLDSICDVINRFAIGPLVKLNGWPQDLAPTLNHGPVAEISLTDLASFISSATGAGLLFPDEELEIHLRERAELPPPPEDREIGMTSSSDEQSDTEDGSEDDEDDNSDNEDKDTDSGMFSKFAQLNAD